MGGGSTAESLSKSRRELDDTVRRSGEQEGKRSGKDGGEQEAKWKRWELPSTIFYSCCHLYLVPNGVNPGPEPREANMTIMLSYLSQH